MSAAGWRRRPRRSASRSIRALPPPKCSTTRTARCAASPPATWASAGRQAQGPAFTRGMELLGKYTLIAEGARGSLAKQLIAKFELDDGPRAAEVRHRPQGALAGRSRRSTRPGLVQHSFGWPLDNSTGGGSFLYHSTTIWWRSASSCTSTTKNPVSVAVRGVPALQDASGDPRHVRGRQAHRLWRARHHRGRLAVGAEADLPGRRADRLRGRLRQRAAHQGRRTTRCCRGMLAAEHVAAALGAGRANDELDRLRGCLARLRRSART